MPDGVGQPGGSAFYSALQAARLGLRTLVVTRGVAGEIEALLAPFRGELALEVLAAPCTTTLQTSLRAGSRRQRVHAWAGPIGEQIELDTAILHLAPVLRETPSRWRGRAGFIALTPQGLAREWASEEREISLSPAAITDEDLPERCDALVLSEAEQVAGARAMARTTGSGGVIAITAGDRPTTVLMPAGARIAVPTFALAKASETVVPDEQLQGAGKDLAGRDLGAGDVFAAAFFVALEQGRPAAEAACFANAAAAVRLAGGGARAIGDRAAIEARVRAATL
jgi:hypothetical protein